MESQWKSVEGKVLKLNFKAYIRNPYRIFHRFNYCPLSHLLSDKAFIKLLFRARLGYKLDLNNPATFNEKLNWLKLYSRKSEYTTMVDKWEVNDFVSERIGSEYLVPTIGVWNSFEEIDFSQFPDQFVLKCTHDSGSTVICKNKDEFDYEKAKKKLTLALKKSQYYKGREWAYKNVQPRIMAEGLLIDNQSNDLPDYKFFCFNGKPEYILFCSERFSDTGLVLDFYNTEWVHMPFKRPPYYPHSKNTTQRPSNLDEMIILAKRLSNGIPFVRVDFYSVSGKIYFGELTLYPGNGFEPFEPFEWDKKFGDLLVLPKEKVI